MVPYKKDHQHIKTLQYLFQQFLILFFLVLILVKSTIIFATSEVVNKSANTSSEEMGKTKEVFDTKKTQEKLTSETGKMVKEEDDDPLSSSAENILNQLDNISTNRDKVIIKSFLSGKRPLLHVWNTFTTKLNDKLGLNLGLTYTSLYQYATDANGTKDGASGDLDIIGTWNLWNKNSSHPSSIGFQTEYRHRYTNITPADISKNVGSLWKTIRGFNREEFSLVEIWWEQQILKDIIGFRIGKLNMKDYFNNYKFKSSNNYFFNTAFSNSPAIAFPGNGGGLVLRYKPTKKSYIIAGIADANGKKTSLDNTFVFNASKYFYAVEFRVKPKFNSFGTGNYSLTLWHREERSENASPSDEGFAISLEQKLSEKIIPFVRYSYSDGDSTKIQQIISTGIGFIDTFGRENDVAGLGLAWGAPSDKSLQDQYTMEIFYRFQVLNHIHVTPGFQLIVNPSNNPDNDVVAVFAIRARIVF
jgi:porin